MSVEFIDEAKALLQNARPGAWVFWAVRAKSTPDCPPPSEDEATAFELVKVPSTGPGGYFSTGILFWDENDEMAENLACCINEECGLDPDKVLEIVGANMARNNFGKTVN